MSPAPRVPLWRIEAELRERLAHRVGCTRCLNGAACDEADAPKLPGQGGR